MYPGYKMTLGGSAPRGPPEKQRAPRKAEAPDGHWMVGGRGGVPGRGPGLAGGQQAAATSAVGRLGGRGVRGDAAGGWRLSGQKTWTTRGAFCTHLFGLFRSDPVAERHRGLTYLLVDLRQPGVTVRPVRKLDGDEGFAEVFFDDAFVPDADVLGEVHQGWSVAMATTGSERGLTLRSPGRFNAVVENLVELYRQRPDPEVRGDIADAWMAARAYELSTWMTVTRLADGARPGAESSLNKVVWSEMDIRLA